MSNDKFWQQGEKIAFARFVGISKTYLSDILHRRRGVSPKRAAQFAMASKIVLGEDKEIHWKEWLFNRASTHPAFYGEPQSFEKKED